MAINRPKEKGGRNGKKSQASVELVLKKSGAEARQFILGGGERGAN